MDAGLSCAEAPYCRKLGGVNTPAEETAERTGEGPPETGHLTLKVLVFSVLAYVLAPLALVVFLADANFYTRMEQWYAMNISLQSVDPTRLAIDDPEADIAILNSLLSPELVQEGFAERLHAFWRDNRDWAIREGDLEFFEITKDTARVVVLLRMDTTTTEGMHYREVRQTTRWEKIDGGWYLADLNDVLVEERFEPWRGVVMP